MHILYTYVFFILPLESFARIIGVATKSSIAKTNGVFNSFPIPANTKYDTYTVTIVRKG